MSVTSLALHVGIVLIRPSEDNVALSSSTPAHYIIIVKYDALNVGLCFTILETMMRRRKCVAEFLIRHASTLPYDCATEMNIPAIPELLSPTPTGTASSKQLHYVQVTWDAGVLSLTFEKLEVQCQHAYKKILQAIIAYNTAESAMEAEHAMIPNINVRRRKPRQGEKRHEHSPKHSRTQKNIDTTDMSAETGTHPKPKEPMVATSISEFKALESLPTLVKGTLKQPLDNNIIVEDIEDVEPRHEQHSSELRPASFHEGNKAQMNSTDQQVALDDGVNDNVAMPIANPLLSAGVVAQDEQNEWHVAKSSSGIEDVVEAQPTREKRCDQGYVQQVLCSVLNDTTTIQVKNEIPKDESSNSAPLLTQRSKYPSVINDTKPSNPEMQVPDADAALHSAANEHMVVPATLMPIPTLTLPLSPTASKNHHEQTQNSAVSRHATAVDNTLPTTSKPLEQMSESISQQTENIVTSTDQEVCLSTTKNVDAETSEILLSKLFDMQKVCLASLFTSAAALSSTQLSNEFERAVLQLHKQILDMVEECLILAGAKHGETGESIEGKTSTNAEFLDFLEAQSKTQVKILEVEVRAGQELLRLHKEQFVKERVEVYIQKSALEEKLVNSDNQLHAKDIALVKLQAKYDKMHRVAAEAQMRAELLKRDDLDYSLNNQMEHRFQLTNHEKRSVNNRVGDDLPLTTKLFSKLSKLSTDKDIKEDSGPFPKPVPATDTAVISSRPSNVAALEAIKLQMARDIQDQIATTNGKTLEEEEEELQQLQRQLAARSSEMDEAMNESRSKLQELLDSTVSSILSGPQGANDRTMSNQEPTIFDSTELVNELIARAESAPKYNLEQAYQCGEESIEESISYYSTQQLIESRRTARDAQSLLYKKWTNDRSRKIAQLANYRDQQAVIQAQQSMKAFQKTLAEFRNQQ
ncbi:unnamed protein product [Phytophthora fragariaefolia]|uniref:Unnamed protein product n=1 Tax=Phytophthora fragariaefolia TaxID=1490495 RepID=A0A9W6TZM7_9STRA|nr:unnamed protein product [Phytophthora fragariaefolia]